MDIVKDELYRVTAHSTAADGTVRADDGTLDVPVKAPRELGGPGGATNPEALFSASYATCMHAAIALIASGQGVDASGSEVHATTRIGRDDRGYVWGVDLDVVLPGQPEELRQRIVDQAAGICPISRSTAGNIEVNISTR